MRGFIATVLLSALLSGCTFTPAAPTTQPVGPTTRRSDFPVPGPQITPIPGKVLISYHAEASHLDELCYQEASKRFVNPVVVCCHGGTVQGQWCFMPAQGGPWRVDEMAHKYAAAYPDRDIVLFVCNRSGHFIGVPRVWYFRHDVWRMPDAEVVRLLKEDPKFRLSSVRETLRGVGCDGSIWESVTQYGSWR